MSIYQVCIEQVQSNPLTAVGIALGGGVLLQRFTGLFGKLSSVLMYLLSSQSSAKVQEVKDDVAKLRDDIAKGNLGGSASDVAELLKDIRDLLAGLKQSQPKP